MLSPIPGGLFRTNIHSHPVCRCADVLTGVTSLIMLPVLLLRTRISSTTLLLTHGGAALTMTIQGLGLVLPLGSLLPQTLQRGVLRLDVDMEKRVKGEPVLRFRQYPKYNTL